MENEIIEIEEAKKLRAHGMGGLLRKDSEIIQNSIGRSCKDPVAKLLRHEGGIAQTTVDNYKKEE